MPTRTTADAVNLLREVDVNDGMTLAETLAPFIETANSLVTSLLGSSDLSSEALELIERWLAAHLVACTPTGRLTMSETIGPITDTYFGKSGYALFHTPYGSHVLLLDTTGRFADWNRKVISGTTAKASIKWGGRPRKT